MDKLTDAPTLQLDGPDSQWLAVEYDLPSAEGDLDGQADSERDRYDEQIYAALVDPSF